MRIFIIISFFAVQLLSILYQLNKEHKYFNWAMYHTMVTYNIQVEVNTKPLSSQEIYDRYRIKNIGQEGRSFMHLTNILTGYENTYGKQDNVHIKIEYTENLKPKQWDWKNF